VWLKKFKVIAEAIQESIDPNMADSQDSSIDYSTKEGRRQECYHDYYDTIMNKLLGQYSYISVIGTHGIGKSSFYP
jgi:hypothetical protein